MEMDPERGLSWWILLHIGHIEALQDYRDSCHSKFYYVFWNTLLTTIHFFGSHFAGVPSTELNLPIIPESAYASALKEYKDINKTDSDGW